jgi:hypothetical protein
LVHPAGNGDQQESEWVKHSLGLQSSLSRTRNCAREPSQIQADPIFGPYGNNGVDKSRGVGLGDVSIDDKVFKDCLVIKHYDPSSGEDIGVQYYAPGIGLVKQTMHNGPAQGAIITLTLRSNQR